MKLEYVYEYDTKWDMCDSEDDDKRLALIDLDGKSFIYEVDDLDIKYDMVKEVLNRKEMSWVNPYDVVDVMDDLYCFDEYLFQYPDEIKERYKTEAMEWFESEVSVGHRPDAYDEHIGN